VDVVDQGGETIGRGPLPCRVDPAPAGGWLGSGAIPLPSRSQRVAITRAQVLADQAARRERDERGRAGAGDYQARTAEARAMLTRRPRPPSVPQAQGSP
jgi:hypothetical protein